MDAVSEMKIVSNFLLNLPILQRIVNVSYENFLPLQFYYILKEIKNNNNRNDSNLTFIECKCENWFSLKSRMIENINQKFVFQLL